MDQTRVRITKRQNPLGGKPFWSMYRMTDGEREAVMYAQISGYEVVA